MSDGYCENHWIGYCPDLSKTCPYCRIAELEARPQRVGELLETLKRDWAPREEDTAWEIIDQIEAALEKT